MMGTNSDMTVGGCNQLCGLKGAVPIQSLNPIASNCLDAGIILTSSELSHGQRPGPIEKSLLISCRHHVPLVEYQ
jgi:hypothetical protein